MADIEISSAEEEEEELDEEAEEELTAAVGADAGRQGEDDEDVMQEAEQELAAVVDAAGAGRQGEATAGAGEERAAPPASPFEPPLLPLMASQPPTPLGPPPLPPPEPAAEGPLVAFAASAVPRARASAAAVAVAAAGAARSQTEAEHRAAAEAARHGGGPAAEARQRLRLAGIKVDLQLARFRLGIPVDLRALGRAVPSAALKVGKSTRLVVRSLRQPGWAAMVHAKGRVIFCTRTDGEVARTAAKRFARLVLRRYSASAAFKSYRVLGLHASARLGFRVDTEGLGRNLPAGCCLAGSSPGSAVVEVEGEERKINVHVYAAGRMKVFDAKAYEEAIAAFELLLPLAQEHGTWW